MIPFLSYYALFITGVFVGMVVGWYAHRPRKFTVPAGETAEIIDHGDPVSAYVEGRAGETRLHIVKPPVVQTQQQFGDAEIVDRPDAARLEELDEDPTIAANKEAVAETLKKFPTVQELIAARKKYLQSINV